MGVSNRGILNPVDFGKGAYVQTSRAVVFVRRLCLSILLCLPLSAFAQTLTDTDGVFNISWNLPSTYNGGTFAYFTLQQTSPTVTTIYGGSTRSGQLEVTRPNGSYVFKVNGCYANNAPPVCHVHSTWNVTVSIVSDPPANPPATFTVPATDPDGSYSVSWSTVSGTSTYQLQEQVNGGTWSTLQNTSATSRSFSGGTAKGNGSYGYRVRACNSVGCSSFSTIKTTNVAIAPGVPANLGVTLGSDGTSISVNWNAASGSVSNYQLQRRINGGGWSTVYSGSALTQTFTGLSAGEYGYQVRACRTTGTYTNCSGWSGSFTGYVPGLSGGVPVDSDAYGLSAITSTTPSFQYIDFDGTFTLSWPANSSRDYYKVMSSLGTYTVSGTSRSFNNLANDLYTFSVEGCYTMSTPGDPVTICVPHTTPLQILVDKIPPNSPPATLTVPASDGDGSYSISWSTHPLAASYELQERLNGGGWTTVQNTSATSRSFSGGSAKGNGSYGYQVRACNQSGCSAYGSIKTIHVALAPGVPASINVSPNPSSGNVTVNWSAASGSVTAYDMDYRLNSGSWVSGYSGSALSVAINGLAIGGYTFQVRACRTTGTYTNCSGWRSGTATIMPPPPVPTGLTVPASDGDGGFAVSWNTASTATTYQLQEQINGGTWNTIQNTGATSRSFSGGTAKGNGSYGYRVSACNAVGCSAYSASKTIDVAIAPGVPANLGVTLGVNGNSIGVNWSAAGGSPGSYQLQRRINGGGWSTVYTGTALSQSFSGLSAGAHEFQVRACKTVGGYTNCSAWSGSFTGYVPGLSGGVPVDSDVYALVNITSMTPNFQYIDFDGTFTLSWSNDTGQSYSYSVIQTGTSATTYGTGSATSKSLNNLADGLYTFRVEKCWTFSTPGDPVTQCIPHTTPLQIRVQKIPPNSPPATLTVPASDGDGSYSISWSTHPLAATYELQESTNSGANWTTIQNTSATSESFSGGTAKGNGSYGYQVRACNQSGCSAYTSIKTINVAIAPGVPANLGVTLGGDGASISASWGAAGGSVSSYRLQRRINGAGWSQVYSGSALSAGPFTNLSAGEHEYQVRACKTVGGYTNCSGWSTSFFGHVPGATGGVPADSDAYTVPGIATQERHQYIDFDGTFTLSWPAHSSALYYKVLQTTPGSATYQASGTSRSFSNLTDGLYTFSVNECHNISTPGGPQEVCTPNTVALQVLVQKIAPAVPATFTVPATDPDGSYTVSWSGVSGAMSYQLQERMNGGLFGTIQNTSATSKPFSGASAKSNGSYGYQVRACNEAGCSNYTAIKTVDVAFAPGVPANLGVTLGGDGTSIGVNWGAASGSVTNYQLQQRFDGGGWSAAYTGPALTQTFSGLTAGEYGYQVRACRTSGAYTNCSAWSGSFTGYVPGVSNGQPADSDTYTLLNITSMSPNFQYIDFDGMFTLSWSNDTGQSYSYSVIQTGSSAATYATGSATSRSLNNLADGLYTFRIEKCWTFSTPGDPVTQCIPHTTPLQVLVHKIAPNGPPATLTVPANDGDGSYSISWSTHPLAASYELQESANGGANWSTIQNTSATSESFSGGTAKGNGRYSYRVRACNGAGCSGYTALRTIDVAIVPGVPASPRVLLGGDGTSISSVSWSAAGGSVSSYRLQRRIDGGAWSQVYSGSALTAGPFTGLSAGAHEFQVRACKTVGAYTNCSAWSGSFTGYVPGASGGVPVDADAYFPFSISSQTYVQYIDVNGGFTLDWSDNPSAEYYKLKRQVQGTPGFVEDEIPASWRTINILADGLYTFSVESCYMYETPGDPVEICTPYTTPLQVLVQKLPPENPPGTFHVPSFTVDGNYTVSWTSVMAAMSYELQERKNGGDWITLQDAYAFSREFTGRPSALYEYRVRPCNEAGCSDFSNIKYIQVVRPPVMPASIAVTLTGNGSGLNVGWSAVPGESLFYQLQRSINGGAWFTVYIGSALSQSYTGLPGASYQYQVRACSSVTHSSGTFNNCSLWNRSITTQVPDFAENAPDDLDGYTIPLGATVQYVDYDGTFTLSWLPTGQYYKLQQETPNSFLWQVTGTSKSFSNLAEGTYTFSLDGCITYTTPNGPGEECGLRGGIVVHVRKVPPVPATLIVPVTSADGSYDVSWSSSVSATGYELQEQLNGGGFTTVQNSSATSMPIAGKTEGGYGYKVRACNAIGCSAYTAVEVVAVTPGAGGGSTSSSGGGEEDDYFPELQPGESELTTPVRGDFSVNQNGAATYSIPLQIPPGRGGLAPELSLEYDSQSGNGLLGMGWSLSGLSAVSRCAATKTPDGLNDPVDFDSNDKYCLGGQKLIQTGTGSDEHGAYKEYRTEIQSYSRIRSYGSAGSGPAIFRVRTRSGLFVEYGAESSVDDELLNGAAIPASRVEAQGRSDVLVWAVNRVSDSSGNFYTVSYHEDNGNGEHYPLSIHYTGNSNSGSPTHSAIVFGYESRTDKPLRYLSGSAQRLSVRLSVIETRGSSGLVKRYKLEYGAAGIVGNSILTGIRECDWRNHCRPELELSWRTGNDGTFTRRTSNVNLSIGGSVTEANKALSRINFGDFDGDGKADIYYLATSASQAGTLYQSKGDGTFTADSVYGPEQEWAGERAEKGYLRFGDFDGDARTDLLMIGHLYTYEDLLGTHTSEQNVIYDNDPWWGTEFHDIDIIGPPVYFPSDEWANTGVHHADVKKFLTDAARLKLGDFDGDGRTDVYQVRGANGQSEAARVYLASGGEGAGPSTHSIRGTWDRDTNFDIARVMFGDFNGDGMTDIYNVNGWNGSASAAIYTADGDGTFTSAGSTGLDMTISGNIDLAEADLGRIKFGDFNGDGMSDVLIVRAYNGYAASHVHLSKGDGTFDVKTTGPTIHVGGSVSAAKVDIPRVKIGDFNGDGMSDVYLVKGSGDSAPAQIYFSRGDGTFAMAANGPGTSVSSATDAALIDLGRLHIDDFDGDGDSDVHYAGGWGDGGPNYVYFSDSENIVLDKIGKAGEGRISVSYTSSTDSTVHADGDDHAARDPFPLVRRVTVEDGVGGEAAKNYQYVGLRVDQARRRMLGFYRMTVTDEQTGMLTSSNYKQAFPYTGLVSTGSRALDARTISSIEYTYHGAGLGCAPPTANLTLPCKVVEQTYDFDSGTLLATVTTTTSYDAYGNATDIEVNTEGAGGPFTTTTVNQYTEDDVASWHLGRLSRSTVTKSAPGNPDSVRTSAFNYNSINGLLIREVIEPDSTNPNIRLTTHYKRDVFGNITHTTLCEGSIAPTSCNESATGAGVRRTIASFAANSPDYPEGLFPTSVTNALGHTETRLYDARFGLVRSLTGPNGLTTTSQYDSFGRKIFEERADGTQSSIGYTFCAPNCPTVGGVTAKHKVTTVSTGSAPATVYFDAFDRDIRRSSPGFDSAAIGGDELIHVDTQYDDRGRKQRVSEPYFAGDPVQWTEYTYDDIDRVRVLNQPHTATNVLTDFNGLTTVVTDVMGRSRIEVKNALGQTTAVTEAAGSAEEVITEYGYDAAGNLKETQIQNHPESLIRIEYDDRGRKSDLYDQDMGHWRYVYNSFGELGTQTDALNQTTRMEYNKLGQLTRRTDRYASAEARTTEFDFGNSQAARNVGKPVAMSVSDLDPLSPVDSARSFEYDDVGRLFRTTDSIGGESFISEQFYDGAGRPKTTTYPVTTQYPSGFKVSRSYNANGYLQKVRTVDGSKVFWEAEEVNARGQTVADTLGNGISTTRVYNAATGWLDALVTQDTQSSALQHVSYGYLDNGSLDHRMDVRQGLTENFYYDNLNRLDSSQVTGGELKNYEYDILGNITFKTGVGHYKYGAECTAGAAGPHAVCQILDDLGDVVKSYRYNANGSADLSAGRAVDYTGFNKPLRFTEGGTAVTFAYGADLNRVFQQVDAAAKQSLTYYVGLGGSGGALFEREIDLTTGQRENRHYIYAGGASPVAMHIVNDNGISTTGASNQYFHHDHLGSVEAISDDSGLATNAVYMSYDAWGLRRNPDWSDATGSLPYVDGARGFTGHEDLPEIGLIHMNGRVYDPVLGRFQSADPQMQPQEFSQGMNRYGYVLNNPLTHIDPTGYKSILGRFLDSIEREWKEFWKRDLKPFLNRLTRHCDNCGLGYDSGQGWHAGAEPSPYGTYRNDDSIPFEIGSAPEFAVPVYDVDHTVAAETTQMLSSEGEGVFENGAETVTQAVTVQHTENPQATNTRAAMADEANNLGRNSLEELILIPTEQERLALKETLGYDPYEEKPSITVVQSENWLANIFRSFTRKPEPAKANCNGCGGVRPLITGMPVGLDSDPAPVPPTLIDSLRSLLYHFTADRQRILTPQESSEKE